MITQERLKNLYAYNPLSGLFVRLSEPHGRCPIGSVAGKALTIKDYGFIRIDNKLYPAHRLAFLYMTGLMPKNHVDHINGVRGDNRWVNIRDVTPQENQKNVGLQKNNTSGIVGVRWNKNSKKWVATIKHNYKDIYLGQFDNVSDATSARKLAEVKYGFHENHGRI